jgi:hypothetical protein
MIPPIFSLSKIITHKLQNVSNFQINIIPGINHILHPWENNDNIKILHNKNHTCSKKNSKFSN